MNQSCMLYNFMLQLVSLGGRYSRGHFLNDARIFILLILSSSFQLTNSFLFLAIHAFILIFRPSSYVANTLERLGPELFLMDHHHVTRQFIFNSFNYFHFNLLYHANMFWKFVLLLVYVKMKDSLTYHVVFLYLIL